MATGREIKRLRGRISAEKAATLIGVDVEKMRKWEQRDADPKDTGDIKAVEAYFGCKLGDLAKLDSFQFIPKEEEKASAPDNNQPIIQVVLNLSYIGKKNADSIDKMADSNLLNAKSIATLVNLLASSSSDLAAQLASVHANQHTADDLPAEAFLGGHGVAPKKRKVHAEKG